MTSAGPIGTYTTPFSMVASAPLREHIRDRNPVYELLGTLTRKGNRVRAWFSCSSVEWFSKVSATEINSSFQLSRKVALMEVQALAAAGKPTSILCLRHCVPLWLSGSSVLQVQDINLLVSLPLERAKLISIC